MKKPTPAVPPTDLRFVDDPDLGSRVLERERQAIPCPQCDGTLYLVERRTGRRVLASWSEDVVDDDAYRTSDDWPQVETAETCERCGYRRTIA
jgi:ssDNA-binding Zn-finger/Zn-ribbon topoisomerase 1